MLEDVLQELKNWFILPDGVHEGAFAIEGGAITLPFLQKGQYFRVCDSRFNDGLHQYGDFGLIDEVFDGVIWALAIPPAVLSLAKEIAAWQDKHGDAGIYQSESFAGYTYTRAVTATGAPAGWRDVFRARLRPWRKASVR